MAKITAIKIQEKRPNRINLFVDGVFAVGVSEKLLVDFDLYVGKELTEKEIEKIKEAESISKCLDKAYRLLSFRPRSEAELTVKLSEKFQLETVQGAFLILKKYNYINDEDFCRFWIENRGNTRGKKALYYELIKKGVAKEVIEEQLSKIEAQTELDSALALVKSKKKYLGLSQEEAYKKIGGYLSRRGFSYEIIKKVIKEI